MAAQARAVTEVWLVAYLLTIPWGPRLAPWSRELALVMIAAGMLLARVRRPGASPPPPFALLGPVLLFGASVVLSILFSVNPRASLTRSAYAPIALLLFLAVQDVAVGEAAYRHLLGAFATVAGLLGMDSLWQFWSGASLLGTPLQQGRVSGSLPNPNDLALIPILLPGALVLIAGRPRAWTGRLAALSLPGACAATILSGSRNAWLGLVTALVVLGALGHRRKAVAVAGAGAAALFAVAWAVGLGSVPDRVRAFLDVTGDPRVAYWLVAWRMFTEAPIVGKGVHTFGAFYLPYLGEVALPPGYTPEVDYIPWAHNLYLEILAEQGLVGAAAFGTLLGAMAVRLARALGRPGDREARLVAAGLAASLAAFLLQAVFDLTFFKDWPLLAFLVLAGLIARLPVLAAGAAAGR